MQFKHSSYNERFDSFTITVPSYANLEQRPFHLVHAEKHPLIAQFHYAGLTDKKYPCESVFWLSLMGQF